MHTRKDVELLSKERLYHGRYKFDRYRMRYRTYSGAWSKDVEREILDRGNTVSLLPYDPVLDMVVLIEQFRVGAYTAPDMSPWQIECVAGIIEPYQTPEQAATREMEEEAGAKVLDLEPVHSYLTSPGCTSETITMYCGRIEADGVGGVFGLAHEGEYIRVFAVTAEEAFRQLDSGRIENGMTIIALHWLRHHRARLREKWGET